MKTVYFGFVLVLALSCSMQPPPEVPPAAKYEYAGCPQKTSTCENDLTLICALDKLRAEYDSCLSDNDCVDPMIGSDCLGYSSCAPPYVASQNKTKFAASAQSEIRRYCSATTCKSSAVCGWPLRDVVPRCKSGKCDFGLVDGGSY